MSLFDRHIAVSAGFVAAPAVGLSLMGALGYLGLTREWSGICVWAGLAIFICSGLVATVMWRKDRGREKPVMGPVVLMCLGVLIICGAGCWYFWPLKIEKSSDTAASKTLSTQPENSQEQAVRASFDRFLVPELGTPLHVPVPAGQASQAFHENAIGLWFGYTSTLYALRLDKKRTYEAAIIYLANPPLIR